MLHSPCQVLSNNLASWLLTTLRLKFISLSQIQTINQAPSLVIGLKTNKYTLDLEIPNLTTAKLLNSGTSLNWNSKGLAEDLVVTPLSELVLNTLFCPVETFGGFGCFFVSVLHFFWHIINNDSRTWSSLPSHEATFSVSL